MISKRAYGGGPKAERSAIWQNEAERENTSTARCRTSQNLSGKLDPFKGAVTLAPNAVARLSAPAIRAPPSRLPRGYVDLFPLFCALFFSLFAIVLASADFLKPAQGLVL